MTIIQLSNGKKVGNFSSPHPFTFEDGSVLPAVSEREAERLKIEFIEAPVIGGHEGDVSLRFVLPSEVITEIADWVEVYNKKEVDIVFCPLPMIVAMRDEYSERFMLTGPFRAIRLEDRIKKLASITKQCV